VQQSSSSVHWLPFPAQEPTGGLVGGVTGAGVGPGVGGSTGAGVGPGVGGSVTGESVGSGKIQVHWNTVG